MTPKERIEFEDMKKRLKDIETVRNVAFVKELQRRMPSDDLTIKASTTAGTSVSVRNALDNGSESVADDYTGAINLYNNGVLIGKIGYY